MPNETKKRQRTCINCAAVQQKSALYRLVRTPEGVVYDESGRQAGRGAYVCSSACLFAARKTKKLERALRCKVDEEDFERATREIALAEASEKNEE